MPEKSFNELAPSWRDLYDKGRAAFEKNNLDYAITIFNQILEKEPGFFDCRQALRAAQYKKAETSSGGFLKKAFGKATSTGPLLAKGQLALRNNALEAITIAEQILNQDPHSQGAHKLLAEAASEADLPKTAVLEWEILYKGSSRDKHVAIKLAEAFAKAGQISRAEDIYKDLIRISPDDVSLIQALKNLSARRTMEEGGYASLEDGSGSYRDVLKNEKESISLEQENREVKTEDVANNLIREYEARLVNEGDNLRLLRSLAELYSQKGAYNKSLEMYDRLTSLTVGSDAGLDKTIAEVQIKRFNHMISRLNPQQPDYEAALKKLEEERDNYRLAECQKRADKNPTDLSIKFELGQYYFEAGKISEAIQEFQKAQANPHKRVQSLFYLGKCFAHRRMYDLAARSLQNAIKEKVLFDDEKKEIIYELGCVYEKMKKPEESIEQFKLIYEVDIGYKDIAAKVDSYYQSLE